jgi:hypothetical protein
VHQAVCANFPSITTYGVWRAGATDHSSGRAVDIMVSGALGWDIANFVRANAGALGVSYVIYAQHIWSVERSGEGLAWHVQPRLRNRQPLRPRARLDLLSKNVGVER